MRMLLLSSIFLFVSQATAQTKIPTFFTVVAQNFDKWDANKDGVISREETDDLVPKRSIQGVAAAALASLHLMQNNKKIDLPPVTRQYLQEQVARDGKPGQPDFQRRYVNAWNKIKSSTRSLISGNITLESMHQGRMGDCYLIAPLGAMVARNAGQVRGMFVESPGSGYGVRFADGHLVNVAPLSDTELAITGTTEGHGLWLGVLEKAISAAKREEVDDMKETDSVAGAIGRGGSIARYIPLLTGHKGKVINFHEKNSPPRAAEAKVKVNLTELRNELRQAMEDKRIVCCSTTTESGVPGLSSRHAYALLKYDAASDVVHLWNPHGNKFVPKGPAGLANGYPTVDGKFTVPVSQFVKAFRSVTLETPVKATFQNTRK
ncbi:MAG TPA: C2 family cysteine protease [Gemmatales bacterium]|nr:C2 family cysteine protease [Gemmatales bacterium]